MTLRPTFRIGAYGVVVIVGLALALVIGRSEPAIVVTPFAVFLAVGLTMGPPPALVVRFAVDRDRIVEGEVVRVTITSDLAGVALAPLLPTGVEIVDEATTATTRTLVLRPSRWGAFDVGTAAARSRDPLGLFVREATVSSPLLVRVHPTSDRLRRAIIAAELHPFVGHHTSRARGDGFDFADLRPYQVGDRSRAVNWRASARRGALWVNDRHPERTGEIVLLLDTFSSPGRQRADVLDGGVRALAALAKVYERTHDRVGLLTFGGHLRWLRPGSGRANLARVIDGLLDSERLLTDTWEDTLRVPIGALPPRSLLLAVTSLDNDTAVLTLLDLRGRGFDVAVLTVDPGDVGDVGEERARRLDALLRDARRRRLERFGIAVAAIDDGVAPAVEEVNAWRRQLSRSSR